MIKAVLLDFDGTLVTQDSLDTLTQLTGKSGESERLNRAFQSGQLPGLQGLVARINLLRGLEIKRVEAALSKHPHLMPGARELTDYLGSNGIVSILASGSIVPVLEYYQRELLKLDFVVGSRVRVSNGVIEGIALEDYSDFDFKLFETKKILQRLGIQPAETLAIGDSIGDKSRFQFAGHAIAINPKGGIEKLADFVIHDDLAQAIPIIEKLNQ